MKKQKLELSLPPRRLASGETYRRVGVSAYPLRYGAPSPSSQHSRTTLAAT
jgi:hypothetical protein